MLRVIYTPGPVSSLIARAKSEDEKFPPVLLGHQEAELCLPLHFIPSFLGSSRRSRCGQQAARQKKKGKLAPASLSALVRLFTLGDTVLRPTSDHVKYHRGLCELKRIWEESKPTNRESAPDKCLDCCYSAAQRDCWAREKIKGPFVGTCNDTAHVYAHHVPPFTALSSAAGV